MNTRAVHPIEAVVLACVAAVVLFGFATAWLDVAWFEQVYAVEDGPVEWATAAALLVAAAISAVTASRPPAGATWFHRVTWIGLTVACLFVAGEEISWGQRIFGVVSPEFFVAHNAQRETNLHNLVVAGVKVNKLVFSKLLFVCAAAFLFGFPALYRRNPAFARRIDAASIPVPRAVHVVALVIAFAVVALIPSRERDELTELAAPAIFALILLYPRNAAAVRRAQAPEPLPEPTR